MASIRSIGSVIEKPLSITSDLAGAKTNVIVRQTLVGKEISETKKQTQGLGLKFIKEVTVDPFFEQIQKIGAGIAKYVEHVKQKAADVAERKEISKEIMDGLSTERAELRAQKKAIDDAYKARQTFTKTDNARIAEANVQYEAQKAETLSTVHSYRQDYADTAASIGATRTEKAATETQKAQMKAQVTAQIEALRQQIANLEKEQATQSAAFDAKIQGLSKDEQVKTEGLKEIKAMITDLLTKL